MRSKYSSTIWIVSLVSLFMDMSSELVHCLLPAFMLSLGLSMSAIGIIDGIAEGLVLVTKVFSGLLSDFFKKRKFFIVLGYGLAALTKPIFSLTLFLPFIIGARFLDRIGKGIREAPRDALIAETVGVAQGGSFGLRQSFDTIGGVCGTSVAMIGMFVFSNNFSWVFAMAVPPAMLSVMLLFWLKEPISPIKPKSVRIESIKKDHLTSGYWKLTFCAIILNVARFSEVFLVLRGRELGLSLVFLPMVLLSMNVIYALGAYPIGALSDRIGRKKLLLIGIGFLILAHLVLANTMALSWFFLAIVLWGLHLVFSQSLLAAMVADLKLEKQGTGYGIFYCLSGVAILISSGAIGFLWEYQGASVVFWIGALIAGLAGCSVARLIKLGELN